jgi:hypothetical protein
MSRVRFRMNITQAEYDALEAKSPATLYFISDKKIICLGSEIYGGHVEISGDEGNAITINEDGLYAGFDGHADVTGVKGAAEGEYRTGNVELAPEDLGAENAANKTGTLDDQSSETQYPSAKAVYGELSALDQGKVDKNGTDRLMTASEGTKLAGIATGAQVNPEYASMADAKTGTNTTKSMSPLMTAHAIGAAGGFTVVGRSALTFKPQFTVLTPSYVLYDYRGIVTVVCNVLKSSATVIGDIITTVPPQAFPPSTIVFPAIMSTTDLGYTCKWGMCYLDASGTIGIASVAGPTRISFSITYSIESISRNP